MASQSTRIYTGARIHDEMLNTRRMHRTILTGHCVATPTEIY